MLRAIHVFIWGLACVSKLVFSTFISSSSAALGPHGCAWAFSQCSGVSSCGARALQHRLSSWVHRLSCSTESGIFPDQ